MLVVGGPSHRIDFLNKDLVYFYKHKITRGGQCTAQIACVAWQTSANPLHVSPAHIPVGSMHRGTVPHVLCFVYFFGSFKDFTLFSVVMEVRSYC